MGKKRKRDGFLWGLSLSLAVVAPSLSGCLRLNEYVVPPTIVDASTGMVYTPGRGTAAYGREPREEKIEIRPVGYGGERKEQRVERRTVAFGNERSQPGRFTPQAQTSSPTGAPGNSLYYR